MKRIQGLGACVMTLALAACATGAGSGAVDAGEGSGGAPVGGMATGGTPVGGMPMGGTPVGGAPVGGEPAGGTGGAPVGGEPAGGTGGAPVGGEPAGGTGGAPVGGEPAGGTGGSSLPDASVSGGAQPDAGPIVEPDAGAGGAIEPPPAPVQTCEAACGRILDCTENSGLCGALPPGGGAQVEALCLAQCPAFGDALVSIVNGQALCGGLIDTIGGLNAEFCAACHGAGAPECGGPPPPPPPPVDCDATCARVVGCFTDGVTCEALGPNDAPALSATCAQACGQFGQLFSNLVSQSPDCGALVATLGQVNPTICTQCHGVDAPACAPPPPPPPPDEACAAACDRIYACVLEPGLCPAADPAGIPVQIAACNTQCADLGGALVSIVDNAADCGSLIDLLESVIADFRLYCSGP